MPSVAGNDRYLQRQINRANVAPMGPIIFGAGDRLRLLDANGNTVLDLKDGGPLIRQAGSMVALATELEEKATTAALAAETTARGNQVSSLQTQINTNDAARSAGDSALQEGISDLAYEVGQVQSGVSTLNGQMANRATTAQVNSIIGVVMGHVNDLAQRVWALEDASGEVSEGQSSYVVPTL